MYRLLSVTKNSIFLAVLLSNQNAAEASAAKDNKAASVAFFAKSSSEAYSAASTPRRIVSVSRRSVSFYDDATVSRSNSHKLDHGHVIGASLMKANEPASPKKHHK
jgi:hypothetical protein